jgi:hypothetical protein
VSDTPHGHIFVDAEKAGDPFWVECVGGPYDGEMVQMSRGRIRGKDGKEILSRGFWVPGSEGHYIERGWANQELLVVRYEWRHDPHDEPAKHEAKPKTARLRRGGDIGRRG